MFTAIILALISFSDSDTVFHENLERAKLCNRIIESVYGTSSS